VVEEEAEDVLGAAGVVVASVTGAAVEVEVLTITTLLSVTGEGGLVSNEKTKGAGLGLLVCEDTVSLGFSASTGAGLELIVLGETVSFGFSAPKILTQVKDIVCS